MKTKKVVFLALCLSVSFLGGAQILEKFDDPVLNNADVTFACIDRENNLWFVLEGLKSNMMGVKVGAGNFSVVKYNGTNWSIEETKDIPADEPKHLFLDREKNVWCLGESRLLKYSKGHWEQKAVFCGIHEVFAQGQWQKDTLYHEMKTLFTVDDNNNFWFVRDDKDKKGMLVRYDGQNLVEYPNTINAKKREIEWTSEKKDAEGNVWFFNRAFIKSVNYQKYGNIDFYDYCGYKQAGDSLVKFEGLREYCFEDGDQLMLFNDEYNDADVVVLSRDSVFLTYNKTSGNLKRYEKINDNSLSKFKAYVSEGKNHDYGFIYGKKNLSKYDGVYFRDINIDSLLNAKKVTIQINAIAEDGIWFATSEGIIRFHDNKWDIFGKKELNSNADPKQPLITYNLGFTKDKTILIGTNLGVYQWKSGKMMPVMADPPQPFIIHEADTLSGNTVLFSTNNGIYQWNTGEWSQITSKFGLQKDIPYKTYFVNGFYFIVFEDGTCSVYRDQKITHFVHESEYKGQGKKIFKGFGEGILTRSDSLLITLKRSYTKYSLGIYNFNSDSWSECKLPEKPQKQMVEKDYKTRNDKMAFSSYVIKNNKSNQFTWIIPYGDLALLKFDGQTLTPLSSESWGNENSDDDVWSDGRNVWLTPQNSGIRRLRICDDCVITYHEFNFILEIPGLPPMW